MTRSDIECPWCWWECRRSIMRPIVDPVTPEQWYSCPVCHYSADDDELTADIREPVAAPEREP